VSTTMKFDVVVVGAGVAGLYASYQLASMGWKVALIESKPAGRIGDKVCADAIGVHHFEEIELTPPSYTIDHQYKGVKIYSPSGKHSIIVPGEGVSVNRIKFWPVATRTRVKAWSYTPRSTRCNRRGLQRQPVKSTQS